MAFTFQQAASNSTAGATSLAVTFANAPASGELIVATVATNSNTVIITAPSGFTAKNSYADTSRSLAIYWKIAGSSESTGYTWGFSVSVGAAVCMRRFSSSIGWNTDQSGGATDKGWDSTSVSTVSFPLTTTTGRLLVGVGYSSNTTSTNKQLDPSTGWSDDTLLYSSRSRSAYRTSLGGSETFGYTLTNAATDTRMSVMAAEFVEYSIKNGNDSTKTISISWNNRKYSDNSKAPSFLSPNSLSATPSGSSLAVSFTDRTSGWASHKIYLSSDSGSTWPTVVTKGAGVTSHTFTGLSNGTYYVKVVATFSSNDASESGTTANGTISVASFTPDVVLTFEGTNGSAVGDIPIQTYGKLGSSYTGGYGSKYSNTHTRAGRSTSMEMSIPSGSDGDPAGGSTGTGKGLWGFNIDLPASMICSNGDVLHSAYWMYFPSDFDSSAPGAHLKFLRYTSHLLSNLTGPGGTVDANAVSNGRLDHLIDNPEAFDVSPYVSHGQQQGWMINNEYDNQAVYLSPPVGSLSTQMKSTRVIPRGSWALIETRVKWTATASQAEEYMWINRQFAFKRIGSTLSWIDETGTLVNRTITASKTLTSSSYCIANLMMFTYWNSNSPQTQSVWLDKIALAKNPASLPDADEYGNPMMGSAI